ncbi:acyl-CoA Delta(11) desaturase [Choristoneura fumiferana]|uniref:acyl-CoA Delta(11) desaturase n=1 Tax=Choristoneura fumiferana TaxID=7141 RepID=UPI003D15DEDF
MAPNLEDIESDLPESEEKWEKLVAPQAAPRKYQIIYTNLLTFGYGHIAGLYGLYLCFTSAKWQTILLAIILNEMAILGITAGAHRLWAHRSYKATVPLQIILIVFNSLGFQNSVIHWVRDHRMHHKYSDTDGDPHNASRGFFYAHVGWLLVKKHPEVKKRGKIIDMSDIYSNPILRFQKNYAIPFIGMICFVLPTIIPMYFWGETLSNAWHIAMLRYVISLHSIFLVNSAAHLYGYRPYDKNILPADNKMALIICLGESFHNYHHVFPWDYRSSELGNMAMNWTAKFIDFFAWIGWAYDLKTASYENINSRMRRTGDGTDISGQKYSCENSEVLQ